MNNFQFDKNKQNDDALDLLNVQKKKLAKQQVLFAAIFLVTIILLTIYIVSRTVFVYYDGYVKLDVNHLKAIDDMYIIQMKANVGDSVSQGDTLFSYVLVDQLIQHNDRFNEPVFVNRTNDLGMQARLAEQELIVLRTQLAELQKQLASENNDIYYGLTNNTAQNDLRSQIEQTKAKIQETVNRVNIYRSRAGHNHNLTVRSGYGNETANLLPFSPYSSVYSYGSMHYYCAPAKGYITNIENPDRSLSFKGDDIINLKYADYSQANFRIMAYVPVSKARDILEADSMEVIVDNRTKFSAHLVRLGLGVQQLPDYLVNNFSRDAMVIMAALEVNKGQRIPRWVLNNDLPVKIRINKLFRPRRRVHRLNEEGYVINNDNAASENGNHYDIIEDDAYQKPAQTEPAEEEEEEETVEPQPRQDAQQAKPKKDVKPKAQATHPKKKKEEGGTIAKKIRKWLPFLGDD